jgi:hypothetical protein
MNRGGTQSIQEGFPCFVGTWEGGNQGKPGKTGGGDKADIQLGWDAERPKRGSRVP